MNDEKGLFKVLLIEDNDDHAEVIGFYIKEFSSQTSVQRIKDGEKAIEYIKDQENGNNSRPNLIMLDLKLPKYDGNEILGEIKKSPSFKVIPVVIFTTSNASSDIEKALNNYANSYILKPIEQNKFKEVLGIIISYWKMNERIKEKGMEK